MEEIEKVEQKSLIAVDNILSSLFSLYCFLNKKEEKPTEELEFKLSLLDGLRKIYVEQVLKRLDDIEKKKEEVNNDRTTDRQNGER